MVRKQILECSALAVLILTNLRNFLQIFFFNFDESMKKYRRGMAKSLGQPMAMSGLNIARLII